MNQNEYAQKALEYAEEYGIYEYDVKKNLMVYYSYFGFEGFYKVVRNLDTDEETRTVISYYKQAQWYKRKHYNYFCG